MPPILAFFLTLAFIGFLFRRDIREEPNITRAAYLPLVWLLIIETRSVCQWLNTFGLSMVGSLEEGTPLDAAIYLLLILAALYVLNRRRVKLGEVVKSNRWVALYLAYCFIAISGRITRLWRSSIGSRSLGIQSWC